MLEVVREYAGQWLLMTFALQMCGTRPSLCLENAFQLFEAGAFINLL
jgi:hypothetical protein